MKQLGHHNIPQQSENKPLALPLLLSCVWLGRIESSATSRSSQSEKGRCFKCALAHELPPAKTKDTIDHWRYASMPAALRGPHKQLITHHKLLDNEANVTIMLQHQLDIAAAVLEPHHD